MKRRMIAAIVAVVLMVLGALLLLQYVASADQRGREQLSPVEVLVVTKPIARGEKPVEGDNVTSKQIPKAALAEGVVTSFKDIDNKIALVDMVAGEQVIDTRFVDPTQLGSAGVKVPEELVQVTVPLAVERVLGGYITAGDKVGVVLTDKEHGTKAILHRVLVARVQKTEKAAAKTESGDAPEEPSGTGILLITFATNVADMERIVWAAENASLWVSMEGEKSDLTTGNNKPVTREEAFR